ncbi:MAG: GNAT family N-acetyltransferase [Anaerolineaceae bacterium]|nr:GNAT family N-acetyltransferase [Anaerolineaceae bacterium]
MDFIIEKMTPEDWPQVSLIYAQGIHTGNATFETSLPSWPHWDSAHLPDPRLVTRAGAELLGWAALSPVSSRAVYAGVAEVSIYIRQEARGHGVGSALLPALITRSEQLGIWTLQASIFPENQASLALHQKFGFRIVGRRQRIAQLNGLWRDTLLIERRI